MMPMSQTRKLTQFSYQKLSVAGLYPPAYTHPVTSLSPPHKLPHSELCLCNPSYLGPTINPCSLCLFILSLSPEPPPPQRTPAAQPSPTGPPKTFETWPSLKSSALRYKISPPARSCALSHRKSLTWTSWATLSRGRSNPWYPGTSADMFLTTYKALHTQVCKPLVAASHPDLYGRDFLLTSLPGSGPACTASGSKSITTYKYCYSTYRCPGGRFSHIQVDLAGPLPGVQGAHPFLHTC
jgi:hypothetical protein